MSAETMNRIDRLFQEKAGDVLSIYMTAGFPSLEDTAPILQALESSGADMVEIGIPFSDPLADGPVIQHSSQCALANGMSLRVLFRQLKDIRKSVRIPLLLMGYLNPMLRFGMEDFLGHCRDVGIDGLIIPDLPPEEYAAKYSDLFGQHGIHMVLLITPHTPPGRVRLMASLSGGFLYMVAEASTTGARAAVEAHQLEYFRRIAAQGLSLPCLVGFGISSRETFRSACKHARGAIIGSAFIRALQEEGDLEEKVAGFVRSILEG